MTAHCLFEQSGTFKNAFKNLGYEAYDYDIANNFNETDYVVDLFGEIESAYDGQKSIFDRITSDDLVVSFFPCTRFEARIPLCFRGEAARQKNWGDIKKLESVIQLHGELHGMYVLLCKLFIVALRGGYKMVVENPYTQPHYLTTYFPIKPAVIDRNRRKNGDYYKKATQYWFLNFEPEQNVVFEPLEQVPEYTIATQTARNGVTRQVMRSMMHPQYAERFIKQYIMQNEGKIFF